jgi:NAD(P)-dependent dehydrogenase (short-subunit alcohol dehydrogenase family)
LRRFGTDLKTKEKWMTTTLITDKIVLVTGANRGIGNALVAEALSRGAKQVYAGGRTPMTHPDERVTPLVLDITNQAQIQAAAEQVASLDLLINNAGVGLYDDLSDRAALVAHLAVNLFGPYDLTQALLPALTKSHGAVVNVLSIASLAALPIIPSYSVSKAAAFSLTQNLRPLLADRGVGVHAVLVGPTDTEMSRGFDVPKVSADFAAAAILDGVQAGDEEIFPHPMLADAALSWRNGAIKSLERQFASFVEPTSVAS